MGCERYRAALSARLDGEDEGTTPALVDAHLAGCAPCRRWYDDAALVTRMARMGPTAPDPGVSEDVLAAVPGPGRRRVAESLRILLGLVGFAQFMLGVGEISLFAGAAHGGYGAVSGAHLWHESASWNIALGAGFGWIALRRTRPSALIASLSVFVGVLTLLSVGDLMAHRVDGGRLLSHVLVVVGYLIVIALNRPALDFGDPPARRRAASRRWQARFDDPTDEPRHDREVIREVERGWPPQSARHDQAA